MKRVHIEDPCHENWNEMTPTERGAFCQKCAIDVYDFSNKSNTEVKSILEANAGKHMCGRFGKEQLLELNGGYNQWENQSPRVFQSKFLLACVLVFGMTLFTGCIEDEETGGEIMGDVAYIENVDSDIDPDAQDPQENCEIEMGRFVEDVVEDSVEEEELMIQGEIEYIPEAYERDHVKGGFKYNPDLEDVIPNDPIEQIDTLIEDLIRGKVMIEDVTSIPTIPEDMCDEDIDLIDSIAPTKDPITPEVSIISNRLGLKVFPNPSTDHSTLIANIPSDGMYEVDLYGLSGQLLQRIFSGELSAGEIRFEIDLGSYESGTYIIVMKSRDFSEQLKVQKVR